MPPEASEAALYANIFFPEDIVVSSQDGQQGIVTRVPNDVDEDEEEFAGEPEIPGGMAQVCWLSKLEPELHGLCQSTTDAWPSRPH
jgi:hypothetical protein